MVGHEGKRWLSKSPFHAFFLPALAEVFPDVQIVRTHRNPAESIRKVLTITNNYDEDFEIDSLNSKNGHVKVLNREKVGSKHVLQLEITPEPVQTSGRFADTFTILLKDGRSLEVTCRGFLSKSTEAK